MSPWWPRGPTVRRSCVDGHPVAAGAVVPVEDGQVLTVGRVQGGLRAYLAVSGGFDVPCGRRVPVDRPAVAGWARDRS